jgi:hypothetical protein
VGLRAVETARRWGERGNEAWAFCSLADSASAGTNRSEAEASYREALAIAEALRMKPVQARCLDGLSRLASRRDKKTPPLIPLMSSDPTGCE